MQKEIKQLEKTKMKLEKLYEKKTGGKKKDVVTDEDTSEEDIKEFDSSTQMIPDENEDGTYDMSSVGMKEEKEDVEEACSTSYEEDDLRELEIYSDSGYYDNTSREYDEDDEDNIEEMNEEFNLNPYNKFKTTNNIDFYHNYNTSNIKIKFNIDEFEK